MTVRRRPAISRANARAVVPLPMAIVVSSVHARRGRAGDRPLRLEVRVAARRRREPRRQRGAAVGADEPALAGEALEIATDRGRRHAQVVGELRDAGPSVGAQVLDEAGSALGLPHAWILREWRADCQSWCAMCAHIRRSVRTSCARGRSAAYDLAMAVPAGRRPRPGRLQLAARHVHRPGPRPSAEPAQGAPARRIPGSVTDAEMVEFKRAVVRALAGTGTGDPARPGDRRRAGHRGRLAARRRRPDRRGRGDRLRGPSSARVSRVLPGWGVEQIKRLGASAAKLLVYYHPDAANAADQERLVADVAAACRDADLALFLEPLSFGLDGGQARRRGTAAGRGRDGPPPDGDRGGRPQGRVPLRPGRHRRGPLARGVRRARRRDAAARGCCCRAAWTTRRSSARCASRARRARAACSSAGRSGRRRRRWHRPSATRFLETTGRQRLARLAGLVDEVAAPWRPRWTAARRPDAPGPGWYERY